MPAFGAVVFRQSLAKQSAKADADTPLGEPSTFCYLVNGTGNGTGRARLTGRRIVVQCDLGFEKIQDFAIPEKGNAPIEKVLQRHRSRMLAQIRPLKTKKT